MPLAIKIDQTGKAAGVAGKAREDLATGTPVTLTVTGGPFLQYRWRIVSKPIDIVSSTRASALLATPSAVVTLLTPIDVEGTYLLELAVDSGNGIGASSDDIVRITFYAGETLATDPSELPQREPAAFESVEHNVSDALDPTGNPEGWARTWRKWFAVIRSLVFGKSWANARITNPSGAPAIVRSNGIASVDWISTGTIEVTLITPMPDTSYSVICSAIATPSSPYPFLTATAGALTVNGFRLYTFELPDVSPSDDIDVCFRVELGT